MRTLAYSIKDGMELKGLSLKNKGKAILTRITLLAEEDPRPDLSCIEESVEPAAKSRLEAYKDGEWYMQHLSLEFRFAIPSEIGFLMQTLETPGVYGVPSDSEDKYKMAFYKDQFEILKHMCKVLNIVIPEGATV